MAEVLFNPHASRGQEGSMDTQDEPAIGSPAEWQDPLNSNADLGSPSKVG